MAPLAAADAKSVFAKAAPSVVVVRAQDSYGEQITQGSGVIVGEGVVITNCHVVDVNGVAEVRVHFQSQRGDFSTRGNLGVDVVARYEQWDLCLLNMLYFERGLPVAKMGAAKSLVIGEEVYAVGAPQGLELSLSRGIVSQLRRGDHKAPVVQTDAAISPGSSGGGLFNGDGELVGITAYKRVGGENLNFAIPVETVADLLLTSGYPKWENIIAKATWLGWNQRKYKEAVSLAKRALAVVEKQKGRNHPDTAAVLNDFAYIYAGRLFASQDEYDSALPLYRRALEIQEVALGKNHTSVATTLDNLADVYRRQGKYSLALPLYHRALKIREDALKKYPHTEPAGMFWTGTREKEVLGTNHREVAAILDDLAYVYKLQGDYDLALPLYRRVVDIYEAKYGQGGRAGLAITPLMQLAEAYEEYGDYASAAPVYRRILEIEDMEYEDKTYLVRTLEKLALVYEKQGEYASAVPLLQRVLNIQEAANDSEAMTKPVRDNLARLYDEMGEEDKAAAVRAGE